MVCLGEFLFFDGGGGLNESKTELRLPRMCKWIETRVRDFDRMQVGRRKIEDSALLVRKGNCKSQIRCPESE